MRKSDVMRAVGVRELRAQASRLLDEVEERGARFVITRRGRPVAMLVPIEEARRPTDPGAAPADVWQELDRLGEEIGRRWRSSLTSGEILSGLRR